MRNLKSAIIVLNLLLLFSTQAFAANLNTTDQWRWWQADLRLLHDYQNQANAYQKQGTSVGYKDAAYYYVQMAIVYDRNTERFAALREASASDPALAEAAGSFANKFYTSANQCRKSAAQCESQAAILQSQGR